MQQTDQHRPHTHHSALTPREPKTASFGSVPGAAFHRLSVENLDRTSSARVNLVVNHVLQPLVVRRTDEYLRRHLTTGVTVVQNLQQQHVISATILITMQGYQKRDNVVNSDNL